jgi:acyl dehydratase
VETITEGRTITETDIVTFSYFTGDWTYLHSDREAAEKSVFGERIAHGYLTLSVSLGLIIRSGAINKDLFISLKTIEHVKFLKPVKIGDTVKVTYSTTRRENDAGRISVTIDAKTINQKNETVMEFSTVHLERPENVKKSD